MILSDFICQIDHYNSVRSKLNQTTTLHHTSVHIFCHWPISVILKVSLQECIVICCDVLEDVNSNRSVTFVRKKRLCNCSKHVAETRITVDNLMSKYKVIILFVAPNGISLKIKI